MKNKEREKKVIDLYLKKDRTPTEISKTLTIERKSVYRILERNNIELKPKKHTSCSLCKKELVDNKKNRKRCSSCNTKIRRLLAKKHAVDYLGGECVRCSWSGDLSGYDFHHRNPEKKSFEINASIIASKSWETIKIELKKCDLLCSLCHRIEHSDYDNKDILREIKNYKGKIFF